MGGIIWLASYPKSGNTWARLFIENLLSGADVPLSINAIKRFGTGEASRKWWSKVSPKPLNELSIDEIARLRPTVQRYLTTLSPENVIVKTHNALLEYRGVPLINPEVTAGAVYILRNPLDVVPSFASHFGVGIDRAIEMMADDRLRLTSEKKNAYEVLSSWSGHVSSWTDTEHPNLLVLRYEEMLKDPKTAFGRLARHIGHNPTPERLERAIRNSSFDVLSRQEAQDGFVERSDKAERFFRSGRSGSGRAMLTRAQMRRVLIRHRATIERFGYLESTVDENEVAHIRT
jgi:hypothetical protein